MNYLCAFYIAGKINLANSDYDDPVRSSQTNGSALKNQSEHHCLEAAILVEQRNSLFLLLDQMMMTFSLEMELIILFLTRK
jgi:hypothetical protein